MENHNFNHGQQISISTPILGLKSDLVKDDRLPLVLDNSNYPQAPSVMLLTPADIKTLIKQNITVPVLSNLIGNEPEGTCTFHFVMEWCEAGEEIGVEIIDGVEMPIVNKNGSTVYEKSFFKVVRDTRVLELSDAIIDKIEVLLDKVNEQLTVNSLLASATAMETASQRRAKVRAARLAARNGASVSKAAEPTNGNDSEDDNPL
jgi:hypothetical protein